MRYPFQAGGALLADSLVYVERKADHEALAHLRNMAYLLVIEPRQQGKTSLTNHLMCHPALGDVAFAYVDVTTPDRSSEATWYQTLCRRILRQLRGFIPRNQWPAIPQNSAGWREFLCDVAMLATDAHRRVVIALDEIGAVTFPGATEFFSVLRDVYNSRQAETEFKQLTFLLAGAFHPRDLIQDDKISPFNIAQCVRLADFTLAQVRELVGNGNWRDEQATALAERIHYWTDGQPYLTQLLCSYLEADATPTDVAASVERLRREDENHLPPMLERLNRDEKLRRYVERILAGERVKFYPRENRRQAQLELLGVIKGGTEGFCIVRNRIYERVLARVAEPTVRHSTSAATPHPELNDALTRRTLALFIGADLPREVTGLPARSDLARELARRKRLDESLSLAEVAQRVSQAGNRWEFTNFIRDQLDTIGKSPQPFHQRIVELVKTHQIETLITTAYDNLLELAFQEAGVAVNRVIRGSDVSFINPDRPTLVKLYGDAQQPDTLVVTDRDHSDLLRDREKEPLVDEARRAFRRNTMFFLGYNLADPDFRFLFDQIAESRFVRTAYAVWPGLPEADVRMWRDRGIVILDVDPLGILGEVGIPPVSPHRPEPTVTPPISQSSIGGKDMDYERGFHALKECLAGADAELQSELATLEERFWKNERAERIFGSSENTRNERAQIIFSLNELALKHCGVSFNNLCQGTQPTQSVQPRPTVEPESPPPPPRRERAQVRFKLQIARLADLEFEVRAIESPMGEPHTTARLPYTPDELIAILKALPAGSPDAARLTPAQIDALRHLGLLTNPNLVPDLHIRVGRALYQTLFPGDVGTAFQIALNQARTQRGAVALQLRFDENAIALARYPWELLYHRWHLLPGGAVELTRYISYPEAPTTLPIEPPLRVLYIESRPTDLASLPVGSEQATVRSALDSLAQDGLVVLEELSPPTYDALIDRIESAQDHILHFDGHGTVARRCPACGAMNYPHHTACQRSGCSHSLDGVPALGYLAFEHGDNSREADWVDSKALEHLLYGSAVRVAVLSACRSSEVRGETLFSGVGPALIQAGVPAVVAMQVPITVPAAVNFMRGFYGALARFESLPAAMTSGRHRLFRGQEWFIPTLYLRSQDDEGCLITRS